MLITLVAQVTVIGVRVGEVAARRVVHHRLGDLAEGGHHSVDQENDEQEAHDGCGCYWEPRPGARSVFADGQCRCR